MILVLYLISLSSIPLAKDTLVDMACWCADPFFNPFSCVVITALTRSKQLPLSNDSMEKSFN